MGYFEKRTEAHGLRIRERIEAPPGDDPVLLSEVAVQNLSDEAATVTVTTFWDVNIHQLIAAPVMTHGLGEVFERLRTGWNKQFVMESDFDEHLGLLTVSFSLTNPKDALPPDESSWIDHHLKTVFLAGLEPLDSGFSSYATDPDRFFDSAGIADPPGVHGAADGSLFTDRTAYEGRGLLAFRRSVVVQGGATASWRYLYGYEEQSEIPTLINRHRLPAGPVNRAGAELVLPGLPWLGRETAWHAYSLQAGAMYQDFYGAHFVDQGSAYGYLQGMSGAPRDFALFTLPMVYLRPDLAREMLRFAMRSQDPDHGGLPYMHTGYGITTGAVIHAASSDLDLFFLWALAEYLGATQHTGFLNEVVDFYPPSESSTGTVLDHAKAAFRHLIEKVGHGPHGLIRCGTGDWNDVLIAFSDRPLQTILHGESSLNAALATVALPALADAVAQADETFADELTTFAQQQAAILLHLWTGQWLARGYLGYGDTVLGSDRLFLDTQAFAVLGGVWNAEQQRTLFDRIRDDCVTPQPVGALCMWPPMEGPLLDPGSDTNGGTWAVIDSWTAWAWTTVDPQAGWEFFLSTTLAAHAEAYPDIWYTVWSGPDSYNAHYHDRPGQTFNYTVTPMTDFPVMNMNRHAGPLLDVIRMAGIRPGPGAIVIDPLWPFDSFALRLPLLGVAYLPNEHRGYYNPETPQTFRFAVRPPRESDPTGVRLIVNGKEHPFVQDDEGRLGFLVDGEPDRRIDWRIR